MAQYGQRLEAQKMGTPILVTGAAGRVGGIGRTVTELLLKRDKPVRAMVRHEDQRAQALRDMGAQVVVGDLLDLDSMHRAIAAATRCTAACRCRIRTWLQRSMQR